jgi:hypothetical protein
MIGSGYFVFIPGGLKRDDALIRKFAEALKLGLYDAKIILGAPGPRKVAAFAKQEEAEMQALALRQAGISGFVVDKDRFSRAPKILRALKAVEDPAGLVFTIETTPTGGDLGAERTFELPQPRGFVRAAILGYYTQTTTHRDGTRSKMGGSSGSQSKVEEPFIHLYSEDPHTILEVRGPKFEYAWLHTLGTLSGSSRMERLADHLGSLYGALVDKTLFRQPGEVSAITAALNVDLTRGQSSAGVATSAASADDTPVAMAASRIIVYSLVFGL